MSVDVPEDVNEPQRFSPWLVVAAAVSAVSLGGTLYLYNARLDRMVERIPVHWGITGEPDKFVPREEVLTYLLLIPGGMVVLLALTFLLPWLSPKQFKIEPFRNVFQYGMALCVIFAGYVQVLQLLVCFGGAMPIGKALVAGIFLFFALLGNVLGKVRRNFWMGVRTPWTLASEKVWNATHRLSAWLYLALGLAGFVAVLAGVSLIVVMSVFFVVVFWPVIYSLMLYKRLERRGEL